MDDQKPTRPTVKVGDSKWTEYFVELRPLPCSHMPESIIKDRRDNLVWKVRSMIQECIIHRDLIHGMKIIDALERLGVCYHFEEETARLMDVLNSKQPWDEEQWAVALQFRLLRQHHYNTSRDVFKNFFDESGDLKENLRSHVDALLNLYDAAHLGKYDEDVLSKAIILTKNCLSTLAEGGQLPKPVRDKVLHTLAIPTHRRIKRLEAKLYISIYENDKDRNYDILELAKLDFHILEQIHRDEVRSFSLWYKDLNPRSILGEYLRERPVECYYWALGIFFEPQYSKARMMLAKLLKLTTFFDDVFDSYGTLEEVRQFNEAVQSWDVEAARNIGKCYEYVMFHISKTLDKFVTEHGASPAGIACLKETLKWGSRCMLQEVIWREHGHVPSLDDYLKEAAAMSTLYLPMAVISFVGMDAGDDVFSWARSFPKIIESAAMICRLMDDVSGHENEKEERSKCVTAVDCYVKEHGVTIEQAKQALWCLIEVHWKIINQEFLCNDVVPVPLLMRVINLVRVMEGMYSELDGYTKCSKVLGPIHKLLNECVDH